MTVWSVENISDPDDAASARRRIAAHAAPDRAAHRPLEAVGEQPPEDDREGKRGMVLLFQPTNAREEFRVVVRREVT